jgi:hypothetical protein
MMPGSIGTEISKLGTNISAAGIKVSFDLQLRSGVKGFANLEFSRSTIFFYLDALEVKYCVKMSTINVILILFYSFRKSPFQITEIQFQSIFSQENLAWIELEKFLL